MKLIPKYQTAWGTLKSDNTQVTTNIDKDLIVKNQEYLKRLEELKTTDPQLYDLLMLQQAIKEHPTSEVVTYTDHSGTPRNVNTNAGAMSGTDPVGSFVVGNVALNPVFNWVGNLALIGLGRAGNNWARAKLISKEMVPIRTLTPTIKPEISLVLYPEIITSKPYIRINPDMTYANEAINISSKDLPWNFFLLIKDNKTPGLRVNPNGEYSVHFKTNRNSFRPGEKEEMFNVLESLIPEGAKVSTWGNLTPGGYSGVNRFGNQYGYTRVGTRLADIPVYLKFKSDLKEFSKPLLDKKDMLVINNTKIKDLSKEAFDLYQQEFRQIALDHPNLIYKYSRPLFLKINGEPEYFVLGEYYQPNWMQFYKSTMYPNRIVEHAEPDAIVPKLGIRLKNDNVSGKYLNTSKKTFITINSPSNKQLVGLHEYISHGTDYAANPRYWNDLFYPSFMEFSETQKLPWYEIRATVNEAKYQVFDKAQKYYNKKNLTQKEFNDYVDKLSNTSIAQTLYHKDRPINGYAKDALDLLISAKNIRYDKYVIDRLRHAFKYGFVGTGVTSHINNLNKKGEP